MIIRVTAEGKRISQVIIVRCTRVILGLMCVAYTHGRKVSSPEKTRCTMISSGSKKQHFWCVRWQMAMHTSRASRFPRRFRQTRLVLFVFHAWRIIIYRRRAKRDTPRSEEFEKISRRFVHISLSVHSYAYLYIGTYYS